MKSGIHPELQKLAKTTCTTCSSVYEITNTNGDQSIETCRNCHPVYTGKQQKDLRGGRVDRYKQRMEKMKEKQGEGK